jgi:hypothetical protein
MSHFTFVGVAFGAKFTVPASVGSPADAKIIARPREDIGRPKKGKKPTAKPKIVVGKARLRKIKKTWMIHLQQHCRHGV